MENKVTELVFILDKSGSMEGLEKDTIGGFNAMIKKQKEVEGKVYVSTILFSDDSKVLHDRKTLEEIEPLTEKDYEVGGMTALLDAIGGAVKHISNIHKYARQEDVPAHTTFVITTDGFENASKKYTSKQIKEMIGRYQKEQGWEFLFLAANIDAVETAESIGIEKEHAVNYSVEEETEEMYEVLGETLCAHRACPSMPIMGSSFEEEIKTRRQAKQHKKK